MLLLFALSCDEAETPSPPADLCTESVLTWSNFGELFLRNWCTGCHGSYLVEADRQGAPLAVDLDTLAGARAWRDRIRARTVDAADMPPAGGPEAHERELLGEWLACGLPGEEGVDPPPPETTPEPPSPPAAEVCERVGRWVLSGATCFGVDITDAWVAAFPVTELDVVDTGGTCAIEYHLADAGCAETQAWQSTLLAPSAPIEFLGTVACEPASCAFAALPEDTCQVLAEPVSLEVPILEVGADEIGIGPLSPPDLAPLCGAIGLTFQRVSP